MTKNIFDTLIEFGREEIKRNYSPGGCIASTRIAIDVLDYFTINAKPLSVKVEIFNEAMVKRIEAGVQGGSHEERKKWFEEDGSWGIGIGFGGQPGRWPGHLVALVENRWLLDMSLDQANRPEKKVFLRPCYSEATQDFMRAEAVHLLTFSSPEGMSLARYRYYPGDCSFRTLDGWSTKCKHRDKVVGTIIRQVKRSMSVPVARATPTVSI